LKPSGSLVSIVVQCSGRALTAFVGEHTLREIAALAAHFPEDSVSSELDRR
jgi:hypothetical protein